ncbi:MAG: hypothetical protein ABEJ93_01590 [Candidatus Nanohalobium sp.]
MEFREGHPANLVFVSTIGNAKTIKEIAEAWEISEEEINTEKAKKEIDRLQQVKFFKKEEDRYQARTDSQAFITEIQNYFKHQVDTCVTKAEFKTFTGILKDQEIKQKVLNTENTKKFYRNKPEKARQEPLKIFQGLLYTLDHILGHDRNQTTEYNQEPLKQQLKKIEQKQPQKLEQL